MIKPMYELQIKVCSKKKLVSVAHDVELLVSIYIYRLYTYRV